MPAAEIIRSASHCSGCATARQSIGGGKSIGRIRPNARIPEPLQKRRIQSDYQNPQLCKLHEQKGSDRKQDLSVFHGGNHGTANGSRSESYCSRYKRTSAQFLSSQLSLVINLLNTVGIQWLMTHAPR